MRVFLVVVFVGLVFEFYFLSQRIADEQIKWLRQYEACIVDKFENALFGALFWFCLFTCNLLVHAASVVQFI